MALSKGKEPGDCITAHGRGAGVLLGGCNVIAHCEGPCPSLSHALKHVTHDPVSPVRGRGRVNGAPLRVGPEEGSAPTVITFFLLIASFVASF